MVSFNVGTRVSHLSVGDKTKTVVEYIEAGRQFADSAVNVLFDFSSE